MSPFDLAAFEPPLRVPELVAGPIMLRPFTESDLPLVREAATDPYIPAITSVPAHYDQAGGRAFILRQIDRSDDGHGYPFVITESADPTRGVGAIGLWLREIDSGRASIGYWVVPSARGRHLAGWALRAVVAFAFETLSIPRLHLFIEPWNVASQRTAASAGFAHEALLRGWERVEGTQHDAYSYVLLHQDWDGDPGRGSGRGSGRGGRRTIR